MTAEPRFTPVRKPLRPLCSFVMLLATAAGCGTPSDGEAGWVSATPAALRRASAGPVSASFTVDNVAATLSSRLPVGNFAASAPGQARQLAWSVAYDPFHYAYVQVIPYGFGSPLEQDFVSRPGAAVSHRQAFARLHAGEPAATPLRQFTGSLFGESVSGSAYVVRDDHSTGGYRGTAQLTTEAGGRIWVVGVSADLASGDIAAFFDSLQDLTLTSGALDRPTTLVKNPASPALLPTQTASGEEASRSAQGELRIGSYHGKVLGTPSWWSDPSCDKTNYWNHTPPSVPSAALLSAGAHVANPWNGLQACGPNPYLYGGAADVTVTFPGGHGELEWECVELSMRFMSGAYGVKAYPANGNAVANNYSSSYGGGLQRIVNGGAPPLPVAGDVLQYRCGTNGHTSVVVSESHDASGTGGLYVIEQNNGPGAGNYLAETRWTVGCDSSGCCVDAWLHQP